MRLEKKTFQTIRTVCYIETTLKGTKLIFTKSKSVYKAKLDRVQRPTRSLTGKRSRKQRAVGTGLRPLRIFAFQFTGSNETHDGSEDDGKHGASRLLLKKLIVNDVDYTRYVAVVLQQNRT